MPEGKHFNKPSNDHYSDLNEELIERYFEETLSEEEIIIFSKKIKNDQNFAENVALQRTLRRAANLPSAEFRAKVHQNVRAKRIRKRQLIIAGIVVLMLLLFSLLYFWPAPKSVKFIPEGIASTRGIPQSNEVFNAQVYFENIQIPIPSLAPLSAKAKAINNDLNPFLIPYKENSFFTKPTSITLYKNGAYLPFLQNCAQDLERLKNSDRLKTLVLKGSAELFTGQFDLASKTLQSVTNNSPTASIRDAANYYLAITQLYLGQFINARLLLVAIQKEPYGNKAKQLIKLLDQKKY